MKRGLSFKTGGKEEKKGEVFLLVWLPRVGSFEFENTEQGWHFAKRKGS